jgi:hypothetical protein
MSDDKKGNVDFTKDPKHDGKADPEVIWEHKFESFLPEEMAMDELATKLKMLIGVVKEDHARFSYKKEIKHYAPMIVDIVRYCQKNGYKLNDTKLDFIDDFAEDNIGKEEESKWDDIVDG